MEVHSRINQGERGKTTFKGIGFASSIESDAITSTANATAPVFQGIVPHIFEKLRANALLQITKEGEETQRLLGLKRSALVLEKHLVR